MPKVTFLLILYTRYVKKSYCKPSTHLRILRENLRSIGKILGVCSVFREFSGECAGEYSAQVSSYFLDTKCTHTVIKELFSKKKRLKNQVENQLKVSQKYAVKTNVI